MLRNLQPRSELTGLARRQAKDHDTNRILPAQLEGAISEGWRVLRRSRKSIRVARDKKRSAVLESRVWTLLYRMGFLFLSGKSGCFLALTPQAPNGPEDQIDVVAADDEVCLAIECKSVESPKKDPQLPTWISRFAELKKRFADAVRAATNPSGRPHIGMLVFTWDVILTDNDRARAAEHGVRLFDYDDLEYFEALVRHLGVAARYQFLCDIFQGKQIRGLEVRVPALRTRSGRRVCYSFSIHPEYLLKIAYVAHRAKGKAIDVDMYQRMISKGRLRKIAEYISAGGSFPTNIVVNIRERRYAEFHKGEQQGDDNGSLFGWLTLRPAYGCAWIIDGQHRLFAYSGHERSSTAFLNVLAYEAMSSSEQARMFVDINSEQRKVKRSLLVELDADLKWDAREEDDRVQAIISKTGLALDQELDSPLRGRVLLSDVKRTDSRCVSLTSISTALARQGFYVVTRRRDFTEYGPLWRQDPSVSLRRSVFIVKGWLAAIAEPAQEWWNVGAGEGGGLAMNNGVTICLSVLRSVMEHLGYASLSGLDNEDLLTRIEPYARCLGNYFATMSQSERDRFRRLQGSDGQITGTRQCQEALSVEFPRFSPPELAEWIESRKKDHNEQGRRIVESIETALQKHVLQVLKGEFDSSPDRWWWDGVPKSVRKKVDDRMNESDGKHGGREQNFDFIHYRDIMLANWDLFRELFGYAAAGNGKEKQTSWIVEVGEMRNMVSHPSRQQFLSAEGLSTLQRYGDWLQSRIRFLESGIESAEVPVADV